MNSDVERLAELLCSDALETGRSIPTLFLERLEEYVDRYYGFASLSRRWFSLLKGDHALRKSVIAARTYLIDQLLIDLPPGILSSEMWELQELIGTFLDERYSEFGNTYRNLMDRISRAKECAARCAG
jgi:hypothetical protein